MKKMDTSHAIKEPWYFLDFCCEISQNIFIVCYGMKKGHSIEDPYFVHGARRGYSQWGFTVENEDLL